MEEATQARRGADEIVAIAPHVDGLTHRAERAVERVAGTRRSATDGSGPLREDDEMAGQSRTDLTDA